MGFFSFFRNMLWFRRPLARQPKTPQDLAAESARVNTAFKKNHAVMISPELGKKIRAQIVAAEIKKKAEEKRAEDRRIAEYGRRPRRMRTWPR